MHPAVLTVRDRRGECAEPRAAVHWGTEGGIAQLPDQRGEVVDTNLGRHR